MLKKQKMWLQHRLNVALTAIAKVEKECSATIVADVAKSNMHHEKLIQVAAGLHAASAGLE
eukprot:2232559-Pyramimonas_sp.AAC.1